MRKGGVAKSSTTHMLAHAFAAEGEITMTVDCDSQQDLTEMMFRAAAEGSAMHADTHVYAADTHEYLKELLPQGVAGRTCYCLADTVRFVLDENLEAPTRPSGPSTTNWDVYSSNLLVPYAFPAKKWNTVTEVVEDVPNLFHVVGGFEGRFEEMESHFSKSVDSMSTGAPKRNGPGCLFHSIWQAGFSRNADVILLDLSPALGYTNQALLLHTDYFLMPCEITRLCEKNLASVPATLKSWYELYQKDGPQAVARSGIRDMTRGLTTAASTLNAELPLPDIEPRFIGIVMTKYDVAKESKKRDVYGSLVSVSESFKSHSRGQLAGSVLRSAAAVHAALLRPNLPSNGFAIPHEEFTPPGAGLGSFRHARGSDFYPQPLCLGRIRKYTAILEAAPAITGLPINAIDESHFPGLVGFIAKPYDTAQEQLSHFRRVMQDMAKFIIYLPSPDMFNFVLDNRSAGRPENERLQKNTLTNSRYPGEHGDEVDAHRTASSW
ncbi:hypothetical protein T492DRAFT_1094012 [Pavlovales sp. CCMP2436]|nr:hypothetical protein T492DRAFT_1094012 [Pavlovales sp. CCMP2436]